MVTEKKTKSTSAKKSTSKKKSTAAKKSTPAKKATAKSKATTKTPKAKKTTTRKPKSTAKKTVSRKKVTKKDLLLKQFDVPAPKNIYQVPPPQRTEGEFDSPPFVSADDEAEVKRIRALLFKKFDSASSDAPETDIPDMAATVPPPGVTPPSPVMAKQSDPVSMSLKWAAVGFALLIALVVKVSANNRGNYYIVPKGNDVEIHQGIFAPMGKEQLITLSGAEAPETIQPVYSKAEIYPYIFNYYVKKADDLDKKPGIPDFGTIKSYLNKAMPYGITDDLRKTAETHLNNIDQSILLYKADVSAMKETLADYEAALAYLQQAADLDTDGGKADLIKKKMDAVQAAKAELEEKQESAAPEQTPSN